MGPKYAFRKYVKRRRLIGIMKKREGEISVKIQQNGAKRLSEGINVFMLREINSHTHCANGAVNMIIKAKDIPATVTWRDLKIK